MNAGVDQTSIGMAIGAIMLQVISEATKSDAMFFMAVIVGVSTIIYNIVKTHNEIKSK